MNRLRCYQLRLTLRIATAFTACVCFITKFARIKLQSDNANMLAEGNNPDIKK